MSAKNKDYFDPINLHVNFSDLEEERLKFWYSKGLVYKYLHKNTNSKKYFSFIDGPITANNPMGVHHAWGRTYKDLWQRFYNMKGYKQRFQNGFDCQGLWVEVEVEKELGIKSKKDIELLVPGDKSASIEKFVNLCKQRVLKFSEVMTNQSKRLGYFMDWDNSYYTMSEQNNYMIWNFIKTCDVHGWLYRGNESVPWCPRCETAISQHEILTEDYKEVEHESIIMKFPLKDVENEYLLVWTTTPWTIPANIAVAVDKNLDYSLVSHENGDSYWVADRAIGRIFKLPPKIVKTVKGSELVGLKYYYAFDALPAVKEVAQKYPENFHKVIETDERIMPINTEEGTGLVHTAVSAGTEDYRLGKKLGLPMIPVIDDQARYLKGFDFLTGKNAKKDPRLVLNYLSEIEEGGKMKWVFDIFKYKHRYPGCWRCKEELVWKVTDEWYIAMDRPSKMDKKDKRTLRKRMIGVAKKINWIPEFGLKREIDWLKNMNDWLISKKNRYWGLALPIWECKNCHNFQVVGSREELKQNAIQGWSNFDGHTPHKPYIDEIKIKCRQCSSIMSRIEPVGNPWLDAGIVAYSTVSLLNTDKLLYTTDKKEWRKWVPADLITESFPGQFKNWFYSLIAMSTVLEDVNPTKTVFGYATLFAEDGRPMHKSWGNSIEYNEAASKMGADVMRWVYLSSNPAENILFGYKTADEVRRKFYIKIWNVANFFITYANLDGWKPGKGVVFDNSEELLDRWIIKRLSGVVENVTTYLVDYQPNKATEEIEKFVDDLSNWYVRRSRDRVGPASNDLQSRENFYRTTYFVLINFLKLIAPFMPYISDLLYTNLTKEDFIHLQDWPEFTYKLSEKIMIDMDNIREVVEIAHSMRKDNSIPVRIPLMSLESKVNFSIPSKKIQQYLLDELNVKKWVIKKDKSTSHKLDTKVTPQLQEEADTRVLIRKIQTIRKELGISMDQKISVVSDWLPSGIKNLQWLKTKIIADSIKKGDKLEVIKA